MTLEFEWDGAKAADNLRAHGISFAQAAGACRDPFAVEWIDDREAYGEERINQLGMCEGVILHVDVYGTGAAHPNYSARRAAAT